MSIRFLKLSLASPESIRSWTERILPNGKRVGKILKGDLIDYKNGLPIRDGLSCERIFGPMVSFTCTCGRFKCIETRGIHIVHDTLRSSRPILPDISRQSNTIKVKQWGELDSPFKTSSNSTRLETKTGVNPIVSQNTISKPIQKLVSRQKSNKKSTSVEPFESSIVQPIVYRQKKMIRFLSDFYCDYESIYYSNKNKIIPSFVSILEEPYNITLTTKNSFKLQTVWYNSKKKQILKSFNSFSPMENVISEIYLKGNFGETNLELKRLRRKTHFLKRVAQRQQNLLKPLYKFIFQMYTKFWFDLKLDYNNFIYEKHIFLWIHDQKFRTSKVDDNFKAHSYFLSKLKIQGLYDESQKLAIISKILPFEAFGIKTVFIPNALLISSMLEINKTPPVFLRGYKILQIPFVSKAQRCVTRWDKTQKTFLNSNFSNLPSYIEFFFRDPKSSYLELKNFWSSPLLEYYSHKMRKSYTFKIKRKLERKNTFVSRRGLFFYWLKRFNTLKKDKGSLGGFQNKICIYWSQDSQKIELPNVFQFSIQLKLKKTKSSLSNYLQIISLYFAKQVKINHKRMFFKHPCLKILNTLAYFIYTYKRVAQRQNMLEKNTINNVNQKFGLRISLFESRSIVSPILEPLKHKELEAAYDLCKPTTRSGSKQFLSQRPEKNILIKNVPNKISLLMQKPILFNDLKSGKVANISFDSRKSSSFDLIQTLGATPLANPFQKVWSTPKKNRKRPSKAWTLFKSSVLYNLPRAHTNKSVLSYHPPGHKFDKNKTLLKPVSMFDFFKKQRVASREKIKTILLTSNHKSLSNGVSPFSNFGEIPIASSPFRSATQQSIGTNDTRENREPGPDQKQTISSLDSSWYQSPQTQETFSTKNKTEMVPLDLSVPSHGEDLSKPYVGANTKQNIRVYKFKNFPPEEIRYCPYCEVELLPNSIRRYRLGYIEFVSPVTHIWYTANSIPLLLNLSKTMIEGIASCHEALSSGFPPVYKWSYNGEAPTSWTFQMQPLKLPINLVPKIFPINEISSSYTKKKSDFTEIIFGSNPTFSPSSNYKHSFQAPPVIYKGHKQFQVPFVSKKGSRSGTKSAKPWGDTQVWTSSFQIIPNELTWEKNFTIYKKRIKSHLIKNVKNNYKEKTSKLKNKELLYNNSYFFSPQIDNTFKDESLNNNSFSSRVSAVLNSNQKTIRQTMPVNFLEYPLEQYFARGIKNRSKRYSNKKETFEQSSQEMKFREDFPYYFWKDISYKFKYLWMFEYPSGKFLPKNRWFNPFSKNVLPRITNDFEKQRVASREKIDTFSAKQDFKIAPFVSQSNVSPICTSVENQKYEVKDNLEPDDKASKTSVGADFQNSKNTFLNQKKKAKQFFFIYLLKNNYFGSFLLMNKPLRSLSNFNSLNLNHLFAKFLFMSSKQKSDELLFFTDKNINGLSSAERFFIKPFNKEASRFPFIPLLNSFKSEIKGKLATVFNISNETMREFSFFNQVPKKVDSNYDLYTATEYEKKREWLKLEGFFEDPSNQKLSEDPSINSKAQSKPHEEDFSDQKHVKSLNETEEKNENDFQSFDNLSLPLVLPFLGKNPDNIEFQNDYSNYENFHIDPLKFLIDLFSTQHIWGHNRFQAGPFDLNEDKDLPKFETNQDPNLEVFTDKQPSNNLWNNDLCNNISITYDYPITLFSNKSIPSVFYSNPTPHNYPFYKKDNLIKKSYSLKKFEWDFSLFSDSNQYHQKSDFWPSLNRFYIISDNLFSKIYPFLPVSYDNFMFQNQDILKHFFNPFKKGSHSSIETQDFRNQKNDLSSLQKSYSHQLGNDSPMVSAPFDLPPQPSIGTKDTQKNIQAESDTKIYSNDSNFTNYRQDDQNYFRKLGRNSYYFKLEEMTRLKKAFLKNLFYRNKFQKTSVSRPGLFKNDLLVLPFTSTSIFHSINNSNHIVFKSNLPNKINQNFMIGKENRFLFGFHLNIYSFQARPSNFFKSYLSKIKPRRGGFFNNFVARKMVFKTQTHFSVKRVAQRHIASLKWRYFTRSLNLNKFLAAAQPLLSKENLKNSLWPLKSNYQGSHQKLYIGNFYEALHENVKNLDRPWLDSKNKIQKGRAAENFLNEQKSLVTYQKIQSKRFYKNPLNNLQYNWFPFFNELKKDSNSFQAGPSKIQKSFITLPCLLKTPAEANFKGFGSGKKTFAFNYLWLGKNIQKPVLPFFVWTPNFQWKLKKQEPISVGIPVSILYDFIISRSSSLIKSIPSLKTKQIENKRLWFKPLEILYTKKCLKEWTHNLYFPAVYLTSNLGVENSSLQGLKTGLKNDNKCVAWNFFWYISSQSNDIKTKSQISSKRAFKIIAFLNFQKPEKRHFYQYYCFRRIRNQINLNKQASHVFNNLKHRYFLKTWSLLNQSVDYQSHLKISLKNETIETKQKLDSLALLGFNTTKIEFFGSLKIYAKRKFLEIWHHPAQNSKTPQGRIPFWFHRFNHLKLTITGASKQKHLYTYTDYINGVFPTIKMTKTNFHFSPLLKDFKSGINENHEILVSKAPNSNTATTSFYNHRIETLVDKQAFSVFIWSKNRSFKKNLFTSVNKTFYFPKQKQLKMSFHKGFLVWLSLYQNQQKAILLPWKKLQPTIKKATLTSIKRQISSSRIVKYLLLNNSYHLSWSRLTKLITEPQNIASLNHITMKRHKNIICYAYAIETIQNKKQIPYSGPAYQFPLVSLVTKDSKWDEAKRESPIIASKSIKDFEFGSKYLNNIQSLSLKISCFSYFDYGPLASLNLGNKLIMQKKTTYQEKILVQKIPKQIPLLDCKEQTLFVCKTTEAQESIFKKGRAAANNSQGIYYIQSKYGLNVKIINPIIFKEDPYTQILKWGERGHLFDKLTSFYKNNNKFNDQISYPFKNEKYNHEGRAAAKITKNNSLEELLLRTDHSFTSPNKISKKLNQKMLSYSSPLIDEKQKSEAWKGNTNYYACISQITSWGSDHGSWILFLKYIRANIYKGDQLLPSYSNKMNFQMMPRTGSIMLQQLLNQLVLIPKALDENFSQGRNFISGSAYPSSPAEAISESSKQKSVSKIRISPIASPHLVSPQPSIETKDIGGKRKVEPDTLPHFDKGRAAANKTKTSHHSKNKIDHNLMLKKVPDLDFNYKSFKGYKTFSMLNGLVFLKKNLQKTIQMELTNTLSFMKKITAFSKNNHKAPPINYFSPAERPLNFNTQNILKFLLPFRPQNSNLYIKTVSKFLTNKNVVDLMFTNDVVVQHRYLKKNTMKRSTNYTNQNALYAYKIKKPIAHKRFKQIYQLNLPKSINNWYRLNNFFSFSQSTIKQVKLPLSLQKVTSDSSTFCSNTSLGEGYQRERSDGAEPKIRNQDFLIQKRNIFDINPTTMIPANQKKICDLNVNKPISCSIPLMGNDIRILKLMYSLIISFQLQFIPTNRWTKQSNYQFPGGAFPLFGRFEDNKKIFNTSYSSPVLNVSSSAYGFPSSSFVSKDIKWDETMRKFPTKVTNKYLTSTIPNTYYYIYSNKNNDFKNKSWYSKSSILSLPNKDKFWKNNGTSFNGFQNSLLQNLIWFRSYLVKSKNISKLFGDTSWLSKNPAGANLSYLLSSSNSLFTANKVIKWDSNLTRKKNSTNGVFRSLSHQTYLKNFYFSNQKNKIYNIFISPLETPISQSLNFGFSTTPFDFVESLSDRSTIKSSQNHKKSSKLLSSKTQAPSVNFFQYSLKQKTSNGSKQWENPKKWSYTRPVNHFITNIKPNNNVISNSYFHQTDNLKISLCDLQKSKFTNNKYENSLQSEFKSVLPTNLQTYKAQIQSEMLFIKLKEIGNHNSLMKKKDTLFKTLMLKMNSSLHPLSSVMVKENQDQVQLNSFPKTLVSQAPIFFSKKKMAAALFYDNKIETLVDKQVFSTNFRKKPKRWNQNQDFIFGSHPIASPILSSVEDLKFDMKRQKKPEEKNIFPHSNGYLKPPQGRNVGFEILVSQRASPFYDNKIELQPSFFEKKRSNFEKQAFLFTSLEFFRMWLFLDSIHYSRLHWFNNFQNNRKVDPTLLTSEISLHSKSNLGKSHNNNNNSFSKILQFYEYRKNFLLKKIFKQRVCLTQNTIWEPLALDEKPLTTIFQSVQDNSYLNIPLKITPILNRLPDRREETRFFSNFSKFSYGKNSSIFGQSALTIKWLILIFSRGRPAGVAQRQKNKFLEIWLRASTLLKRSINIFYDQQLNLAMKYEFKPFGSQIKHGSIYSDWKQNFQLPISNLKNSIIGSFKNQTRFRLLTVPQIFDLKEGSRSGQNNLLSIMRKNEKPINILGPLVFSSSIRPYQKTITFPVLKVLENQTFWGTPSILDYDFKKSLSNNLNVENFHDPIFNFNKFELNENTRSEALNNPHEATPYINVSNEKLKHGPIYYETFSNPNRRLSSETLFREENLKISSSYKALLRKAKILEDYPVPDPDPIDSKSICLKLLNGSIGHPFGWNLKGIVLGNKLPLFGSSFVYQNKQKMYPCFYSNKNAEANRINWGISKSSTRENFRLLPQFLWDGDQNRFRNFIDNQNQFDNDLSEIHQKTSKNVFSIRDQTKFENETMTNLNDGTSLSISDIDKQNQSKKTISEPKRKSGSFSTNQKISLTGQNRAQKRKSKKIFTDLIENSKSSKRNGIFNYGRNLRKLRLQYLRNFRRLRFIEYLKATYIKPEWMILSLLPVLPPDLRPVIANPRGYITGDINTHYQNVIYRNNNIEKLLDTFWIPRKFYSKISFSNYQKATALMLSSRKSDFYSIGSHPMASHILEPFEPKGPEATYDLLERQADIDYLSAYNKESLKFNGYPISKLFLKFASFPVTFLYENKIQKTKIPTNHNEWLISYQEIYSPNEQKKSINKSVKALQSNILKPTTNPLFKTQLADFPFSPLLKSFKSGINENRDASVLNPLIDKRSVDYDFSNKFQNVSASMLKKTSFHTETLQHNELIKRPFNLLLNHLLFLNPIQFDDILQNNLRVGSTSLKVNNQINKNSILIDVKKSTSKRNLFKNTKASAIHWKLERLISPMFSKLTTPYFNLDDTSLSDMLYLNKRVNSYSDKFFLKPRRGVFFKSWAPLKQIRPCGGFFESKNPAGADIQFKNIYKALIVNEKPFQQDLIKNEQNNFLYKTTNLFVPEKMVGRCTTPLKLNTKTDWFNNVSPWSITKYCQNYKKSICSHLYESRPYNIHYKPLLKLYNHKSFFGSNIGIATGYNEIVQALRFKALYNESLFDKNSEISTKNNLVPALKTKIIRTQALHDSKPLQEMQYSLQKAVDALIDNSQKLQSNVLLRKGRPLKSLSDNLKGKEGRFRQHLLGKRVDYSGRSVIVVGPDLKLYECGIPLIMALRLFQPFLILYLIYRFKIASLLATQLIQRKHPMVINLLKKFIETWPVLLNRAPTLHRMNIQAFKIRLVQGKAILLHPLVCSSYNADFDGDQMGVHVPITQQARAESWKLLWSINNSIGIASRQPLFLPSQDMVIGNYYLTAPPIDNSLADFHFSPLLNEGFPPVSFVPKHTKWSEAMRKSSNQISSHNKINLSTKSISSYPFVQQGFGYFQRMNHYFFSLEEAYQYYLNTTYRFHINTPLWFRFSMVFETPEHEKPIEITIDKNGNTIYTTKYYEKQLKRNRILGKNAFYFTTPLDSSINKPIFKQKSIKPLFENFRPKFVVDSNFSVKKGLIDKRSAIILSSQIVFNKNLRPILLNQLIRSTFGRIEFYYEAFYAPSLGFKIKKNS